jgi:hypothetical protein
MFKDTLIMHYILSGLLRDHWQHLMLVFIQHGKLNQYILKVLFVDGASLQSYYGKGFWQHAFWDPTLLVNIHTYFNK